MYPHIFTTKCKFCLQEFKDVLSHQLFSCTSLKKYRRLLRSKLVFYNFPEDKFSDNKYFLKTALERKIWTSCFCEFLADIDYGSKVLKWKRSSRSCKCDRSGILRYSIESANVLLLLGSWSSASINMRLFIPLFKVQFPLAQLFNKVQLRVKCGPYENNKMF